MCLLDMCHAAVSVVMVKLDGGSALKHHRLGNFHLPVFHTLRHLHDHSVLLACVGYDEVSRDGLECFRDHDLRSLACRWRFSFGGLRSAKEEEAQHTKSHVQEMSNITTEAVSALIECREIAHQDSA